MNTIRLDENKSSYEYPPVTNTLYLLKSRNSDDFGTNSGVLGFVSGDLGSGINWSEAINPFSVEGALIFPDKSRSCNVVAPI